MFEQYYNFLHTPFTRDIPEKHLYSNPEMDEVCSRLEYAARNRLVCSDNRRCGHRKDHSHTEICWDAGQ
jgi:hypothetical protein